MSGIRGSTATETRREESRKLGGRQRDNWVPTCPAEPFEFKRLARSALDPPADVGSQGSQSCPRSRAGDFGDRLATTIYEIRSVGCDPTAPGIQKSKHAQSVLAIFVSAFRHPASLEVQGQKEVDRRGVSARQIIQQKEIDVTPEATEQREEVGMLRQGSAQRIW